jgi:hypothetical protein
VWTVLHTRLVKLVAKNIKKQETEKSFTSSFIALFFLAGLSEAGSIHGFALS